YDLGSTLNSAPVGVAVNPVPTIALTSPLNGATYTAPATINLAASVTANGHSITQVQFYNGSTLLTSVAVAPYTFTWTNVAAGNYKLTATLSYDNGSKLNSAQVSVGVKQSHQKGH